MPQTLIFSSVQYFFTSFTELKKRVGIFVAVPYEPNVEILFFLPGGSTRNISSRLKAAADLTIVPKFLAFAMLNISM